MTAGDMQQDRIVIDDLHDPIDTPAMRAATLDWWHKVAARQRAAGVEPVVIKSRVHDEDLAAPLLTQGGVFDFLVLPMPDRVTVNGVDLHRQAQAQQEMSAHNHGVTDPGCSHNSGAPAPARALPDVYAVIGRERGVNVRPGLAKAVNEVLAKHVAGVALARAFRFR